MKDEVEENKNNIINEQKICSYCNMSISSDIFQDHILCHQISEEEEEKEEEKIDDDIHNNKIENKNTDDTNREFGSKFFGFFGNIGNKAKDLFKKKKKKINIYSILIKRKIN
jgi:hypothetical protein